MADLAHYVRHDRGTGNPSAAMSRLTGLVTRLDRHVQREEEGIFRAMRASGELVDEIEALEGEPCDLAAAIAVLDPELRGRHCPGDASARRPRRRHTY